MKKYQNKYRIASARLKNYDYSSEGAYFITICTKNRKHFFGEIIDDKMVLNEIGQFAQQYWGEIPQHFANIKLDEMVVMPNHIHGILWIENRDLGAVVDARLHDRDAPIGRLYGKPRNKNHKPEWKPGTIGVIMNQYKRICTIKSREISPNFAWQPRFHDHIIRNEKSLNAIRKYIIQNPKMWQRNCNNDMGLKM